MLGFDPFAGEIEIPRLRGKLKQQIDKPANQEVHNQVDLQVNIDLNSRLLGKQSLGVQFLLENKIQFTDNLLFPMIEKEQAIHFTQLSETEWRQLLSRLEDKLAEWWKRVGRS